MITHHIELTHLRLKYLILFSVVGTIDFLYVFNLVVIVSGLTNHQ